MHTLNAALRQTVEYDLNETLRRLILTSHRKSKVIFIERFSPDTNSIATDIFQINFTFASTEAAFLRQLGNAI